jgi:hypothetical protein
MACSQKDLEKGQDEEHSGYQEKPLLSKKIKACSSVQIWVNEFTFYVLVELIESKFAGYYQIDICSG